MDFIHPPYRFRVAQDMEVVDYQRVAEWHDTGSESDSSYLTAEGEIVRSEFIQTE